MTRVLIATLGAEPQVISITTELLCRAGPIDRVIVLHTAPNREPIASALPSLIQFFSAHVDFPPLELIAMPIGDVLAPSEMRDFSDILFRTLKTWIGQGATIELLLAGGRKPMAMMGMNVAQMLLGPHDHLWYLYSDEDLRRSGRMSAGRAGSAELVPIPLAQLGPAAPRFTQPFTAETVSAARQEVERSRMAQLEHFVNEELTAAERSVAALVATEVLTISDIANRLHKSPKTVSNQLNSIYSKLETRFDLQADKGVKREFLRQELAGYFGG